jgi:hypothetical protein
MSGISDYIPHGMVTAFAGIVTYVFRDHIKQDDARFTEVKTNMGLIASRQTEISDQIAVNHAEILRVMLEGVRK